jgi:transposase
MKIENKIHSNTKVTRARLLDVVRQFPESTLNPMEACGKSKYWARTFAKMGFNIKLIPAQHVKPFVAHQKMMLMMLMMLTLYVKRHVDPMFTVFQLKN